MEKVKKLKDISVFLAFSEVVISHICGLFSREVGNELAIHRVCTGARNISLQLSVDIGNGQVAAMDLFESLHDMLHGVVHGDRDLDRGHDLTDSEPMVEFCAKHDVAYLRDVNFSQQHAGLVEHRQKACLALADGSDQLA